MAEQAPRLKRELGLWDLVLFNVAAVAGVRWLSAAAHTGPGSITLWILAVLFFFLPSALSLAGTSFHTTLCRWFLSWRSCLQRG